MSTGRHWKRLCFLPKYSFLKDMNEAVRRVESTTGNWVNIHDVQEIVGCAETDIYQLRGALNAMLTYFGMDEEEHNTEVFKLARFALEYTREKEKQK